MNTSRKQTRGIAGLACLLLLAIPAHDALGQPGPMGMTPPAATMASPAAMTPAAMTPAAAPMTPAAPMAMTPASSPATDAMASPTPMAHEAAREAAREAAAEEGGPRPTNGAGEGGDPPPDAVAAPPEGDFYRRISLEASDLKWLEPGQRGLIEAHPLVMGLGAMALCTVALLFFFLRGIKRPREEDR